MSNKRNILSGKYFNSDIRKYLIRKPRVDNYEFPEMYSFSNAKKMRAAARRIRRGLSAPMRALSQRVHAFKRLGNIITLGSNGSAIDTVSGTAGTSVGNLTAGNVIGTNQFGLGLTFALNQVSNFEEITNLFDNYRLKMIKLRMDWSYNQAPAGMVIDQTQLMTGTNSWISQSVPRVHFCPDEDDGTAPNQSQVLQNSFSKTARLDRTVYCTIRPRYQAAVSNGTSTAVAGGLGAVGSWLDCSTASIPHSGFKAFFIDFPKGMKNTEFNAYQWTLTITPTYYIEAKNVV
jgi:hypothetical protein